MQKEKLAQQLATELKFLRAQISPHFLFNVLTNLMALARKQSDQLEPALIRLSDLMRYMLYNSQAKKVALQQEIEYLNSYIQLQKLRFGNDIPIITHITRPVSLQDYRIEPMLLIPFVENAFKHGIESEDPAIQIKLIVENQVLEFEVQNRFGIEPADYLEEHSGIGLSNVQSRLHMLYPGRHRLTIAQADGVFSVTLSLPLLRCVVLQWMTKNWYGS